jgi:hypothetical protein
VVVSVQVQRATVLFREYPALVVPELASRDALCLLKQLVLSKQRNQRIRQTYRSLAGTRLGVAGIRSNLFAGVAVARLASARAAATVLVIWVATDLCGCAAYPGRGLHLTT